MAKLLTPIGEVLRDIRSQRGTRLIDMAADLGVSPAYLSSVETGRKKLTEVFLKAITQYVKRIGGDTEKLQTAADQTRTVIDLNSMRPDARQFVAAFARRFENDTNKDLEEFWKLINKEKT